jgi:hypothetical protein
MRLATLVYFKRGFDVIHGCNPPDLIFLVALPFKLLGKRYIFDHHDINPELYESKFNRRWPFWNLLKWAEWMTFGRGLMGAIGRARIEQRFAWTYEGPKLIRAHSRALASGK